MQQHSPLPWKVVQEPEYGSRTRVMTANKSSVASTEQPCYVVIPNGKTQEANAQFIVRAVNSYYDLLEACKLALNEAPWQPLGEDIRTVLRDTITKAQGGEKP